MFAIFLAIASAYALGLAILGYVHLLAFLQRLGGFRRWSPLAVVIAKGAHFVMGIAGMVIAPAFLHGRLKGDIGNLAGIAFGVTILLVLVLVFRVLADAEKEPT